MKQILKSKRGDGYVDVAVEVIVLMMLLVLFLNVYQFYAVYRDLDHFAQELVRSAAVHGSTDCDEVTARYEELKKETGLDPTVVWQASYYEGSKVQYGDSISVTLTVPAKLSGLGIALDIGVDVKTTYSGLSQKYWKDAA